MRFRILLKAKCIKANLETYKIFMSHPLMYNILDFNVGVNLTPFILVHRNINNKIKYKNDTY
ncbi:hypothetical protein BpHYR1_046172 [Brachionus plicatilis]|uniref:Uncharacterized protein n=1 Tax=Brachionus plicatilis TaxID=10195 RepID=A0A3M7QDC9_BRAPC|nr:hypothetical protein BpHYR1_046172 [Brachionus plicatilis]